MPYVSTIIASLSTNRLILKRRNYSSKTRVQSSTLLCFSFGILLYMDESMQYLVAVMNDSNSVLLQCRLMLTTITNPNPYPM